MTIPLVTIGVSMRDSASTIDACLRSILAQTFSQWELRLFDDGSSDTSVARARAIDDPRIFVVADGVQRGLGARMNQAIDAAQGRYFARMDADDIAYPDRLERQLAYLEAHPDTDLLGAAMMVFKDAGEPVGLHPVHTTHDQLCARPYAGFYLPHPTWMGRIEWFRRWRYDPSYSKAQDQELLRRAYRASCYAALAEPLVGYRQDALSIAKSWRTRYHVVRSVLALARREGVAARGIVGMFGQGARAVVDTIAIGSGAGRHLLRHRALPYRAADVERWRVVWRDALAVTKVP